MDVNDSCRLCFGNLRIDGKLRVLASWEQHSAGVLRHRHERPPPFAPTNLSLLWLARTRSYRCKHSTEEQGQTIGWSLLWRKHVGWLARLANSPRSEENYTTRITTRGINTYVFIWNLTKQYPKHVTEKDIPLPEVPPSRRPPLSRQ